MKQKQYLCFDIGGTHVKWGLVREQGEIIEKGYFSSQQANHRIILQGVREKIIKFSSMIEGIAISTPGFIDSSRGYIEHGGAIIGFNQFHLQDSLEQEFHLPVSVENDVNCVALAEKWLGNGRDLSDFICLTVGTGIGGALVLNDQLYRGHAFRAGEFGYMITQGIQGNSPLKSSLNGSSSLTAIRKKYASYKQLTLEEVTGEKLFQAYDQHDAFARELIDTFYQSLAIGIYNTTSIINPQKVLIGGGVTGRPTFINELDQALHCVDTVFHVDIDSCHFKNDAGIVGALAFFHAKYQ
ncbi:beta-glucoside kinase [Salipaludibacillus keqinensis]|uniref:Beta-glucoside kinase n=1 Tax=Salipaludibacillus keqinensis TaxID=2045207 RepID=A0A323TI65_9BACI|nr:ROK family protein [Salipaludibacillus keqinensis]PYZ93866.1 beta-glucoside kinase [Salipaludibacillus keqinensis]